MANSPSQATNSGSFHPVALAYAVAALQGGTDNLEAEKIIETSISVPVQSDDGKNNEEELPQRPQSGLNDQQPRSYQASAQPQRYGDNEAGKRLARSRERNREHARLVRNVLCVILLFYLVYNQNDNHSYK